MVAQNVFHAIHSDYPWICDYMVMLYRYLKSVEDARITLSPIIE